jgi:hypothetical protein
LHNAAQAQGGFGLTVRKACDGLTKEVGDTLDCEAQAEYGDLNLDVTVLTEMVDLIPKGAPNPPGGVSLAAKIAKPQFDLLGRNAIHGNAACSGGGCDPVTGSGCTLPCILGTQFDTRSTAGLTLPGADEPGSVFFKHDDFEVRETDCLEGTGGVAVTDQVEATFSSACLNQDPVCNPAAEDQATASRTTPCGAGCPFVTVEKVCSTCDPNGDPTNSSMVTITVRNTGDAPATNCQLADTFDPGGSLEQVLLETDIAVLDPNDGEVEFVLETPGHDGSVGNVAEVECDEVNPAALCDVAQVSDSDTAVCPCAPVDGELDHFMFYKVRQTKKCLFFDLCHHFEGLWETDRFVPFGPVHLEDQFISGNYAVVRPKRLGLPADKNGEGILDPDTHLTEYRLVPMLGYWGESVHEKVRVSNQCNEDLLVKVLGRPRTLLVPTAKSLDDPDVLAPLPGSHGLDHFLCYSAIALKELRHDLHLPYLMKGVQVEVRDQFQELRRYDLSRVTRLCTPVDKSEDPDRSPYLMSLFQWGTPKPIEPAAIRNPDAHLVCYKAKVARRMIPQDGCGPVDPCDRGEVIEQPRHTPVTNIYTNNQFGPLELDTVKEVELCIPSEKSLLAP